MQNRSFKMHNQLLFHVIQSQAGTPAKAVLELLMNSVDAGATRVDVKLTADGLSVADDGRGFTSRTEIEDWVETFGTPHKEGDALYGRFRMGRGQIMAFASTRWRTGRFEMRVDLKKQLDSKMDGLSYQLATGRRQKAGCLIEGEWYERPLPSDLDELLREIRKMAAWLPAPVHLNGQCISKDPKQANWQIETADAWISLRATGPLLVYNQGAFVAAYNADTFGTGGTVVTKRPLKLNFARNDILVSQCAVWKRLRKYLRSEGIKRAASRPKMTDAERQLLIDQCRAGEARYADIRSLKLITDITGRNHSPDHLARLYRLPVTVAADAESQMAEVIHQRGIAFVLSPLTLERFDVDSVQALASLFNAMPDIGWWKFDNLDIRPFEELAAQFTDTHTLLGDAELREDERAVLEAARRYHWRIGDAVRKMQHLRARAQDRKLHPGVSDVAQAWTDGKTFIALHRSVLAAAANDGLGGFVALCHLLLHEYLHDTSSAGSHRHDHDFYQGFHDAVLDRHDLLMEISRDMCRCYLRGLREQGRRLHRTLSRDADQEAALGVALE